MGDPVRMACILKTQYEAVFSVINSDKIVFEAQAATPTPKLTHINPKTDEIMKTIDAIAMDSTFSSRPRWF